MDSNSEMPDKEYVSERPCLEELPQEISIDEASRIHRQAESTASPEYVEPTHVYNPDDGMPYEDSEIKTEPNRKPILPEALRKDIERVAQANYAEAWGFIQRSIRLGVMVADLEKDPDTEILVKRAGQIVGKIVFLA